MPPQNQTTHLSKLLSYILRHKPSAYEIVLDENGYTNVDELVNKLNNAVWLTDLVPINFIEIAN